MGNVGLHADYLLVDKNACQWIFRVFNEDWADVLVQVFHQTRAALLLCGCIGCGTLIIF